MKTPRVLIVDDEGSIRRTVAMALEEAGFRAETASDGREALDRLDHDPFELMVLDLKLPGVDGLEVLRQAQARHPELPVVMITAHGDVASAVEALQAGALHFIQKPFPPERLQEAAAAALAAARPPLERWYDDHVRDAAAALRAGRLAEARTHAHYALTLDGTRPEGFNLMGVVHQLQGADGEARRCFAEALTLEPGYAPAVWNQALQAQGVSGGYDLGD